MAKSKKTTTREKGEKIVKAKSKPKKASPPLAVTPKSIGVSPMVTRPKMAKPEVAKGPVRKSSYNKTELEYFKKIILEKKKEILEELETLRDTMMDAQTGEYASENSMYSTHMEQGTDAMEREKTFLFASREGKFLNYLEDALTRIDKGDYGRCITCGKLIEKERLEAVPHAQQCLQCKLRSSK